MRPNRPIAHGFNQSPAEAPPSVVGVHVQLIEVSDASLEHLDLREPDGCIAMEGDPQLIFAACPLELGGAGCFAEDRFGRMANE